MRLDNPPTKYIRKLKVTALKLYVLIAPYYTDEFGEVIQEIQTHMEAR